MLFFTNDYGHGAHEKVLAKLIETNRDPQPGYGSDVYTKSAAEKILAACDCKDGGVYFMCGGTQTNSLVISYFLQSWEGVIAADTGHVNVHEAGAVEANGHKVLALPGRDGKISAAQVEGYLKKFYADPNFEHEVFPGMVYISWPTELGTLYTKDELAALSEVCRAHHIPLFLDGARMASGLAASDVTLADIARLADVFYIGGTKCGALCGEAVVFPHGTPDHFLTFAKQHGALMAKGRLPGAQFDALFTGGLYEEIGAHAVAMAMKLKKGLMAKGYSFYIDSPTNQQFVILKNDFAKSLMKSASFELWEPIDATTSAWRFCTSWATEEKDIDQLLELFVLVH